MNTVFNFFPLVRIIVMIFAIFGFFTFLHILVNTIKDIKIFTNAKNKDTERELKCKQLDNDVIMELAKKFPDVSEEFMKKPERLQNIENNQEIHDIRKQIKAMGEQWKSN